MSDRIFGTALTLRQIIEAQYPPEDIERQTQALIAELGGRQNLASTSPGAAALYLVSLILTQPL